MLSQLNVMGILDLRLPTSLIVALVAYGCSFLYLSMSHAHLIQQHCRFKLDVTGRITLPCGAYKYRSSSCHELEASRRLRAVE